MAISQSICSVESCGRSDVKGGQYCGAHRQRVRKYGDPRTHIPIGERRPTAGRSCVEPSCSRKNVVGASDLCYPHYKRSLRGADLSVPIRAPHAIPIPVMDFPDGTRKCQACGEVKLLGEFHKDKKSPKGHRKSCKPCRVSRETARYWTDPEGHKSRMRTFRANNIEHVREREARYYEENRDSRIESASGFAHKRRASMYAAPRESGITRPALRRLDGDHCCYCGIEMVFGSFPRGERADNQATIEHVLALSRGGSHTWANCALACWRCNISKGARDGDWRIRDGHRLAVVEAALGA